MAMDKGCKPTVITGAAASKVRRAEADGRQEQVASGRFTHSGPEKNCGSGHPSERQKRDQRAWTEVRDSSGEMDKAR